MSEKTWGLLIEIAILTGIFIVMNALAGGYRL